MKAASFAIIFLLLSILTYAQETDTTEINKVGSKDPVVGIQKSASDSVKPGKVTYHTGKSIKNLQETYKEQRAEQKGVPGYRVQIHFGTDINKANEIKADFLTQYPEEKAYNQYESPNFRVRVGNFRTRLSALKFKQELKLMYPYSFVVQDLIDVEGVQ